MSVNKHILIIAPHPDDDVIGMGGTIAVKAKEGYKFTIVYITNGGGSSRSAEYKDISKQELIELRKKEAEQSIIPLVKDPKDVTQVFFGFESSTLFEKPELYTGELGKILSKQKFMEVYIPYPEDRHTTHRVCAVLSLEVLRAQKEHMDIYAYETWDPIPVVGNTVFVDISKHYKQKLSAVSCHKSQCSITPFDEGIIAKNRYNAVFKEINAQNKMEYAEIFLKL